MTGATDRARKMLAELAVTTGPDCTCSAIIGHTKSCPFERWVTDQPQRELADKAPATLAVAITLAEALESKAHWLELICGKTAEEPKPDARLDNSLIYQLSRDAADMRKALAEWERLLPEDPK